MLRVLGGAPVWGVDRLKWVMVRTSHKHTFMSFPQRLPRGTFTAEAKASFERMLAQNATCADIRMANDVLCSKHVYQNAVRDARGVTKADQARALRDAVRASDVWTSEIHLDGANGFLEAFFVNQRLLSLNVPAEFVLVDDTSCVNTFHFPVITVLCPTPSGANHVLAWGIIRNRTTQTLQRFFSFVAGFFPNIGIFMCDRHFAQRRAISHVFGDDAHIFHCCVHVARNIKANTGQNSTLASQFWAMRFRRTKAAEDAFIATLERYHDAKRTVFTTQLLNALDSFLPSKVDAALQRVCNKL